MYFSPIELLSLTSKVEFTGSRPTLLSSWRSISAIGAPAESRAGLTVVTTPISSPPMWTSAFLVTSLASAIWRWSVYLGTNGSPLLAL